MIDGAIKLSRVFGPFLVIMGIWLLSFQGRFTKIAATIKANPAILYIGGIFNLLLGLFIVNTYNVWVMHLSVLVTLLGWVFLIRGILIFFATDMVTRVTYAANGGFFNIARIIFLIWGIALCWLGFWY